MYNFTIVSFHFLLIKKNILYMYKITVVPFTKMLNSQSAFTASSWIKIKKRQIFQKFMIFVEYRIPPLLCPENLLLCVQVSGHSKRYFPVLLAWHSVRELRKLSSCCYYVQFGGHDNYNISTGSPYKYRIVLIVNNW